MDSILLALTKDSVLFAAIFIALVIFALYMTRSQFLAIPQGMAAIAFLFLLSTAVMLYSGYEFKLILNILIFGIFPVVFLYPVELPQENLYWARGLGGFGGGFGKGFGGAL